jgi:microcystin-dependent protein
MFTSLFISSSYRQRREAVDQYVGEIRLFAGNVAPQGWEFCDGRLLLIKDHENLYSLIGDTYGGSGFLYFALPDLRGRTPMHMGQGNGLSKRVLGTMLGHETIALTAEQIPSHTHSPRAATAPGTQAVPTDGVWASASTNERQYTRNAPNVPMSPNCLTVTGGLPHQNRMPFQAVSFIIAILGQQPPPASQP